MPVSAPLLETKRKLPHLPELDGLRGLACLAVVFHHFMQPWREGATDGFSGLFRAICNVSAYGALGVDVFFVLSGFLISSLLLVDREKSSYFHNFYWKRALRILPVYLVHLTVMAILVRNSMGYILLSSIFLVNFADFFHMTIGGPTWTLSIEEQFYVLWPQAVRRLRLEYVYWLAFGLIAMSNLGRIIVPLWHGGCNLQYTFYRCDGLAFGAVLACQWFSPGRGTRSIRGILILLNSNVTLLLVLAAAVMLMLTSFLPNLVDSLRLSIMNYLVYRLLRFLLGYRERTGSTFAVLASAPMVYLGAISYALYMYQATVLYLLERHFGSVPSNRPATIAFRAALTLVILLIVCTISRYAMELPVQRLRRYILRPSIEPA